MAMQTQWGTWRDVHEQFRIPRSTQKKYRLTNQWAKGVIWFPIGTRKILLNLTLIGIWLRLRDRPAELEAAIAQYQAQLPEHQPTAPKRGRKPLAA